MIVGAFRRIRPLLILGRVSNLPTVWSNCLAGWWLGGGGNLPRLPVVFAGLSCLYLGGMFLNDAFDVEFDRNYRRDRPIPSGAISRRRVWRWGLAWLVLGATLLFCLGLAPGILGLGLVLGIIAYDALHKLVTFSPILMGLCRFFVYVVAAAVGVNGINGEAIWCGLALAAYVTGLSFLARRETVRRPLSYWPLTLLGLPVLLAVLLNAGRFRAPALLLAVVLILWEVRCLRPAFRAGNANVGRTVGGLLAGIIFVDWLAAAQAPKPMGIAFLALFGSALLLQKSVPAT